MNLGDDRRVPPSRQQGLEAAGRITRLVALASLGVVGLGSVGLWTATAHHSGSPLSVLPGSDDNHAGSDDGGHSNTAPNSSVSPSNGGQQQATTSGS